MLLGGPLCRRLSAYFLVLLTVGQQALRMVGVNAGHGVASAGHRGAGLGRHAVHSSKVWHVDAPPVLLFQCPFPQRLTVAQGPVGHDGGWVDGCGAAIGLTRVAGGAVVLLDGRAALAMMGCPGGSLVPELLCLSGRGMG